MEEENNLDKWLRKNFMETNEFCKLVGCSRQIIWRVKKNKKVSEKILKKIREVTNDEVTF